VIQVVQSRYLHVRLSEEAETEPANQFEQGGYAHATSYLIIASQTAAR
jgi:hypothetical protein